MHPLMIDVGFVSELQGDEPLTHRKPTSERESIIFTVEFRFSGWEKVKLVLYSEGVGGPC